MFGLLARDVGMNNPPKKNLTLGSSHKWLCPSRKSIGLTFQKLEKPSSTNLLFSMKPFLLKIN
jgi:hypothetical protein